MEKQQEQQRINIFCIAYDIVRNIWIAVLVAISVALLAYIVGKATYQPTYTSESTFVVTAKTSSTGAMASLSKTRTLAEMFQTVMDSQILKKIVCEKTGIDSFSGTIETSIVPETNLLTMSVTSTSPDVSFRFLKGMMENYSEVGKDVLSEVVLEVFEEPSYTASSDQSFQGRAIMKEAAQYAFLITIFILAIISYLKDTVKSEKDVPLLLDTTLLISLRHEMKVKSLRDIFQFQKRKLWITDPMVSFGYVETIKKIRTKLLYHMEKNNAKVILVTSATEGEGKTTVAINLALSMSMRSRKVLLIEGNLRDETHMSAFSSDMHHSWGRYLQKNKNIKKAIYQPQGCKFQVLSNQDSYANATELLSSNRMKVVLDELRQEMDVIIIDAPHGWKRSDTEILARLSDISLLVVKQHHAQVEQINDTIDMLNMYGQGVIGCVFNDVKKIDIPELSDYGYGYGYGKYRKYGSYRYGSYAKRQKELKDE